MTMSFAMLLFTSFHDKASLLSSLLGVVVCLLMMIELHRRLLTTYRNTGLTCLVLLFSNNILYHTGWAISYLPLLQKLTMLVILVWILTLNRLMKSKPMKI